MHEFIRITRALSDLSRLRMLMALANGELCVCQLTEFSGLAASTVSKHMSILREAGLVEARKDSRWVYYRLPGDTVSPLIWRALQFVREHLTADTLVAADAVRIAELLREKGGSMCQSSTTSCIIDKQDAELKTA
ncbi:metalloregulator ArsR/SmtB family transcription factor [bacterium]|nr:metalloregulator ArsR/SmtB family transcription factor [bacterium]MBU1983757.1 metalloregulator ArsR/SmtB family transcription factor [bacterium]